MVNKVDYRDGIEYHWVVTSYDPRSDQGKNTLGLAEAGIGYVLQNKNRTRSENIIVAFKLAKDKPLPYHVIKATPQQVEKLESRSKRS